MPPSMTSLSSRPRLPYKDHPIYQLRRITLWTIVIGATLNTLALSGGSPYPSLIISLITLALSFIFIIYDLITWAIDKAFLTGLQERHYAPISPSPTDGDEPEPKEPKWPKKKIVIIDFIFAVAFQWLFWFSISFIEAHSYYYSGSPILKSYAALSALVMSLLHARAFWKELMARQKAKWLKILSQKPCQHCGAQNPIAISIKPGEEKSDGASFGARKTSFKLPPWAEAFNNRRRRGREDDVEATGSVSDGDGNVNSLLITPEGRAEGARQGMRGYGTLSESVKGLNAECSEVVRKKMGNKRLIGEDWLQNGSGSGSGSVKEKAAGTEKGKEKTAEAMGIEELGA